MEGHQKRIPAHLVKAHVDRLRAAGMTIPSIAAQAGIAKNTVDNIAHDRRSFTTRATATAIAQLVPANQTPDRIPAWRVQRRLQALYALGWTVAEIARHTDWMDRNVNALMYPRWRRRETVDYATFTTFDRVFRDLCMKIPPRSAGSVVAVRRAAERGWVVPLGWDDIDRDVRPPRVPRDSGKEIDEAIVLRVVNGEPRPRQLTHAEAAEAVRRLVSLGYSTTTIERVYGFRPERYHKVKAAA